MSPTRNSCLSAVIVAAAIQTQVNGFVATGGVVAGRSAVSMSSLTQGSSSPMKTSPRWAKTSFELGSTYAEYMATREKQAKMPPPEKEKSLYEEYSRAKVSAPGASHAAPAPAPSPVKELSPYEEYMASRNKLNAAAAKTTPEEKEKSSVYGDYMASRTATEGVAPADCAEEECDADEVVEQASLFEQYMASRGMKASAPAPAPAAPEAAAAAPSKPLSFYEEYMLSRQKVNQAGAAAGVKPEEIKKVSEFESYAAKRAEREAAEAAMPSTEKAAAAHDNRVQSSAPQAPGAKHVGTGGMADTRDPAPLKHEDPRKSIAAAPTFAEYLKSKRN